MVYSSLNEMQLDALKEITNIGAGWAATALSQLIEQQVMIHIPEVKITEFSRVSDVVGGAESSVAVIYFQVFGDAQGSILLIFPERSAEILSSRLLRGEAPEGILGTAEGESVLKEVGNILSGAYLNAFGNTVGLTLIQSTPHFAWDVAGTVMDYVLMKQGQKGDHALTLRTQLKTKNEDIQGHFFLLPDPQSLEIILKAIDQKIK
jgi:chemotaxis protein CheC